MKSYKAKNEPQTSKKENFKTNTFYLNHDKVKIDFSLKKEISVTDSYDENSVNKIIDLNDFPVLNCVGKTTVTRRKQSNNTVNLKKSCLPVENIDNKNICKNEDIKQTISQNNNNNFMQIKEDKLVNEKNEEKNNEVVTEKKNKKKALSSKKVIVKPAKNPYKKKRTAPISVNLIDVINLNNSQKNSHSKKETHNKNIRKPKQEQIYGNILDSSNPIRKRGKYRENKKKKLTNLKLKIITERILKQKQNENNSSLTDNNIIDFKLELENYLKKLNEIKLQKKIKKKVREKEEKNLKRNKSDKKINNDKFKENNEKEEKNFNEENHANINVNNNSFKKTVDGKTIKFSSKLREYCENLMTPSLDLAVTELIKDLIRLQDRAFVHDPIKAKAKKRHISGLREVKKYFTLNKIKMLIIPPNLEKLQMEGSVFDMINELKDLAKSQNVPCVFALNRFKLGRCAKKNVSISAFGVINYEGLEDRFQSVLKELEDAKKLFVEKVKKEDNIIKENEIEKINLPLKTVLKEALAENSQKNEEQY